MMKTFVIRATGIILFNLFFAWLSLCLIKVFLIAGLFADDVIKIDLSTSELHRLRFIKEAMVDSSQDSMFIFSVILFLLAASSFACYLYMRVHLHRRDKIRDCEKFMRHNSTATVWWFSALSSVILLSLPPFTSMDVNELRKEREANSKVFNTLEEEKQHVNFMMRSGRLAELKEEYPKFLNGQEIVLTLDQTTLTSMSLNNPISFIPLLSTQSTKTAGSPFEAVKDIMVFTEQQSTNKLLTLQANAAGEVNLSMETAAFTIRSLKDTCISLIVKVNPVIGKPEKILLAHNEQHFCVKAGIPQEVLINARTTALPSKFKIELALDIPSAVEISDAALTLVKNYKERYFDSSFCLEGKDLAYPKNIRSYLYIPNFASLDPASDINVFSSFTCQQATMRRQFIYPYI